MSSNSFGDIFKITTFGESHGLGVGVVIDGCPSGLELDETDIQTELDRRKPGQSELTSPRKESDKVKIVSGVFEGKTTGSPICMLVENLDQKSEDYDKIKTLFRPGHADFTYNSKYKVVDPRGGGRSSARIMIARVAAGAVAKKYLKKKLGIEILAYTESVGELCLTEERLKSLKIPGSGFFLTPVNFKYLEEIYQEFTSEIVTYMFPKSPESISETASFIADTFDELRDGSDLHFLILKEGTEEFLGICGLHGLRGAKVEPGIWIKKSAWGQGYGKKAVLTALKWLLLNRDFQEVIYPADEQNFKSRRIPELLGGQIHRKYKMKTNNNRELNIVEYVIPKKTLVDYFRSEITLEIESKLGKKDFKKLRSDLTSLLPIYKPLYETVSLQDIESNPVRCPDINVAKKMSELILKTKENKDSIGGTIIGCIRGLPVGLGQPEFDKFQAVLSKAILSINATKAFEIGSGFTGTKFTGSVHNDIFKKDFDGNITTYTNNAGGVLGGLTNGNTVYFKVGIKPVATISKTQKTIDKQGNEVFFEGKGRHDPCVLPRAVPIVEAMSALVVMDFYLKSLAS